MRKLMLLIMALFMFVSTATADIPVHERSTLHGRYDPERYISESQITELLNAGFSMPTGGNQRALEFFVVTLAVFALGAVRDDRCIFDNDTVFRSAAIERMKFKRCCF